MAFKQRSSGPFKMMGSSPARDGQATKGKLKKTFTGPTKPMVDKDGDGIPIGIDIKDTPGGKQSTPPKPKSKDKSKPKAEGYGDTYEYKSRPKTDPRKRPYDDGRNKGTLKGNTKFESDAKKFLTPQSTRDIKTTVKNKVKKAYDYFTKK